MSFIETVIRKIKDFFYTPKDPESTSESWICVFLRKDSDYLFLSAPGGVEKMFPLMVKSDVFLGLDESEEHIGKKIYETYELLPERIVIHEEVLSLQPFLNRRLSFATVELSEVEFAELSKQMQVVHMPALAMNSDNNLFFRLLTTNLMTG